MKNSHSRFSFYLFIIGIAAVAAGWTLVHPHAGKKSAKASRVSNIHLPLYFVENRGQMDSRIDYYVPGKDKSLYFNSEGLIVSLTDRSHNHSRWNVKMDFVDADPSVKPVGQDSLPATVNYFKGPKSEWKTGLKTYSSLKYTDLWKGIDLIYSGEKDRMEYRFILQPDADPSRIRLSYRGAEKVFIDSDGKLKIETPTAAFENEALRVYQEKDGKKINVAANFRIVEQEVGKSVVGFELGDYDRKSPLIIDPEVYVYSGFIGGANDDYGFAVAVDSAGSTYVTGNTGSPPPNFPVAVGPDTTINGVDDAFVAKVTANGASLVYLGYIGGSGNDTGTGIAVDASGNAFISGYTTSTEATFPEVVGPSLTSGGGYDAFVAEVAAGGASLVYCGFIGGAGTDEANAIALDSSGNAYVAGLTASTAATFPETGGPFLISGGDVDAFVAKIPAGGGSLTYAGFIGGSGSDIAYGIAVDGSGNAYVVGSTTSTESDFPLVVGPDLIANGDQDAFIAKVAANGLSLVYSGFIGGSEIDQAFGVAVDATGHAYVTGATSSTETSFPVKDGPDLTQNDGAGIKDAFVTKVSLDGTSLGYSGFIGGAGTDYGQGIVVDGSGNAYITGYTNSTEATFPVKSGPGMTAAGGSNDAFVAKVLPDGKSFGFSGFIGGSGDDQGHGIALDASGNVYVTGESNSPTATFPLAIGPALLAGGNRDAFVAKLHFVVTCGDGFVEGSEACDDGNANNHDACLNTCVSATCGDGVVDTGVEQCDDGSSNSDTVADACRTNCTAPVCGDGVVDAGEECDTGNGTADTCAEGTACAASDCSCQDIPGGTTGSSTEGSTTGATAGGSSSSGGCDLIRE